MKYNKGDIIIVVIIVIASIITTMLVCKVIEFGNKDATDLTNNKVQNETTNQVKDSHKEMSIAELMDLYEKQLGTFVLANSREELKIGYAVVDVNEDKTPELIIESGSCDADHKYNFYGYDKTVDANDIIDIGEMPAGHADLYLMNDNTLMKVYAQMGLEGVTRYELKNNMLNVISTKDRVISDSEDYVKGDKYIEFVDHLNKTVFDSYK